MRLLLLSLATITFLTMPAQAEHSGAGQIHDVTVKVNGLVCDFCAQALEKVFGAREEVNSISVDLDNKQITIDMKDGADIEDNEINSLITDSGYDVQEIIRH